MLERLLSTILLTVFLLMNLATLVMKPFVGAGTRLWKRILGVDIPKDDERSYGWLHTLTWIAVGVWAVWKLRSAGVLAEFFGFLSFRSGANVTRTLVYGLHDQGILKEYSEGGILSLIGNVMKFSLLMETVFMASIALAYKTLSITEGPRISAGGFILSLWVAGLIFGLVFGWFTTRGHRGVLLQNVAPVVLFFSARTGKNRTDKIKGKVRSSHQSLSSRLKRLR